MKTTLTTWQIADALKRDENANWSHDGANALAEYLEQWEEDALDYLRIETIVIFCGDESTDGLIIKQF